MELRLAAWRPYLLRRVRRVGGAVHALVVEDDPRMRLFQAGALRPQDLLAPLRPGALETLRWEECHEPLPPAVLEALPRLAGGLTRLALGASATPPELPASLQLCSRLEVLSVRGPLLAPDLHWLTALRGLRHLQLEVPMGILSAGPLALPARAELAPCLQYLLVDDDAQGCLVSSACTLRSRPAGACRAACA